MDEAIWPRTSPRVKRMSGSKNFRCYDEAASWAATALQDNADYQPGLRIAAASMHDRTTEQAHKALARLRQLNPALRVSTLKNVLGPYRRAEDLSQFEEDCGKLGCPNEHRSHFGRHHEISFSSSGLVTVCLNCAPQWSILSIFAMLQCGATSLMYIGRRAQLEQVMFRHRYRGYRLACRLPNKAFSCRPRPRNSMVLRNG